MLPTYTQGVDQESFFRRYLVQDGAIRQLEIIGEAVKNLSRELRIRYTSVPWQDIAGTRDKLIHQYFGVDLEKVWLMVQDDLPVLKADVIQILQDLQSGDTDT
ncbi:MAG TPA: hypothetical protein DEP84_16850 [Chloroflexi bacterium]|nr:hypothetical protein [Chloroflexota bacterium]